MDKWDRSEVVRIISEQLYVAILCDVLDELGHTEQALPANIRPLDRTLKLVGYARTGLYRDVYHVDPARNPYEKEIALVDDLHDNEVAVFACSGSQRIGPWGELLSTAAKARGAAGCVTDGLVRDVLAIERMRFPVFHAGISPRDSKGRGVVTEIDVPIEIGHVKIATGDLVVGDADGIVCIPFAVINDVLQLALKKVEGESATRQELEAGVRLKDVFEKYGIL
jgi:4-hydroxy-4-methyl-2-oxoglutarate aldolase